jgi:flagellar hook assembly protein FlgD
MDSNEEMQQIVQISSMQNMSTMSADLTQMTASQTWSLANSYLGRQVTLNDNNGNPVAGQITAIDTSSSTPSVQVNGTYYPLTSLTSIQLATTSAPAASAAATTTTPTTTPAPAAPAATPSTVSSIASSIVNAILPSN